MKEPLVIYPKYLLMAVFSVEEVGQMGQDSLSLLQNYVIWALPSL
jgi:hypothetical protein